MPRYFFDVVDGLRSTPDPQGTEFANLEAAREEALATLGEIAKDELPDGDHRDFQISIRDDSGTVLLKATLALRVER